jgi:hypothetical protein
MVHLFCIKRVYRLTVAKRRSRLRGASSSALVWRRSARFTTNEWAIDVPNRAEWSPDLAQCEKRDSKRFKGQPNRTRSRTETYDETMKSLVMIRDTFNQFMTDRVIRITPERVIRVTPRRVIRRLGTEKRAAFTHDIALT